MSRAGSNLTSLDFSVRWFFIPPFVAIFTVAVVNFFSSGLAIPVDPAIRWLSGLMFALLTVLYGIFIKQGFLKGLFPVQLIAQGILLCPLSLQMGALPLSWIGVLMVICGAVTLVAMYYRRSRASPMHPESAASTELDNLPLPFAIIDANGYIISISNFLLLMVQKTRDDVNGEQIDSLLPLDQDTISIDGKKWRILRTPMDDETYYFQLEEVRDVIVSSSPHIEMEIENSIIDPATSLYNQSYAIKRVEEELYRIYRYKRWMSAALLRVDFPESEFNSGFNPKKEDEIFNAYCRFVNSNTRETDIICLAAPREILIVMPETLSDGAQDAVSKLLDFTSHTQEETQEFSGVMEITERIVFFNASSGVVDFDRLIEKLDEAAAL